MTKKRNRWIRNSWRRSLSCLRHWSIRCSPAGLALILFLPGAAMAQDQRDGLALNLVTTQTARASRQTALSEIERNIEGRLPVGVPVDPERVRLEARETYLATITFQDWYNGLTPESQAWFTELIENVRPSGYTTFEAFLTANGQRTIAEVRDSYPKRQTSIRSSQLERSGLRRLPLSRPTALPPPRTMPPPLPAPPATTPREYASIGGSKLVAARFYEGAARYHLATPDQDLFLRGSPSNTAIACRSERSTGTFPSYCNIESCDACCGPAAAQSVFAWFNTSVKKDDGSVATTTDGIQKRLAVLMDTKVGIDYTDPDDLDRVLRRPEFQGTKGYCEQKGDGSRPQLHYMLSRGTPVILLWTAGSYAHYVTVYGYDAVNDLYDLANAESLHWETLRHRWSFEAGETDTNVALWAVGAKPYSLWAYSEPGCDTPWEYDFTLGLQPSSATSLSGVYYDTFLSSYVSPASDPQQLNFYAYLSRPFPFLPIPSARISSGGETTPLSDGTPKIIEGSTPVGGAMGDNSIGQPILITVDVAKSFVDSYPDAYCGFAVLGVNGETLSSDYAPCPRQASPTPSGTYQYRYNAAYDQRQRQIDFTVHGGLRKISWQLSGCQLDSDLDGRCNAVDADDDNDSIPDVADNCPLARNPDQRDDNHNGIGFECDRCEKCMAQVSAGGTTGSLRPLEPLGRTGGCVCAEACDFQFCRSSDDDELIAPLDDRFVQAINFMQSKWWGRLVGPPPVPSARVGRTLKPGANGLIPVASKEFGALLNAEAVGIDSAARELAFIDALLGPPQTGIRAPRARRPEFEERTPP